ncbi:myotubularin-related protein 11 isoform X2 [Hyla sarda]|uniref:myotubularin-related protein 11 isoform X2 n=1 Tax=Hyla sarda TaxID=327740 RepID=UPI0024C26995|nr:myotubularin-related protein 11 isoform X2 [Hyla sarda]
MLPRPKNTFTLKQDPREIMVRSSKSPIINHRSIGLKCLPGEHVHEESLRVRKRLHFKDGYHDVSGSLYCTSYRIAFRPDCFTSLQDSSEEVIFDSDNDIALPCADRILAVAHQSKVKVVTPSLSLKFDPEEVLIYYRGFRLMHFHFSDNGLKTEAVNMTNTMAKNQQVINSVVQQEAMLRSLDKREMTTAMDYPTRMFESAVDWENEIERLGATGLRVTPHNERCDTCTSLSKYFVVPCKLLDNDLKKTFAHFQLRRIPRWSWHHPGGSDLLRSAGFQTNTDPDKEDVRLIRSLLFGNHTQCVIIDTSEDLPSVADIQASFLKLRALCCSDTSTPVPNDKWLSNLEGTRWLDHVRSCLKKASEVSMLLSERNRSVVLQELDDRDVNCLLTSLVQVLSDPYSRTLSGFQSLVQKEWVSAGHPFMQRINHFKQSDKEESPVFLLFLDCVWQCLQQFPTAFEFTESYLLALHDSTYNLFCSTFTHNCQWDRIRGSQRHSSSQTYTPVNGWRDIVHEKIFLNGDYKTAEEVKSSPPTVWEWNLFYHHSRRQQFHNPMFRTREQAVLNGNGIMHNADKLDVSNTCNVYLLSKGVLILQSPFFPRKSVTVSRRGGRRSLSVESLLEEEKQLRSNISSEPSTMDLLLPLCLGPWVRLWKRCYLRCATEVQGDIQRPSMASLAEELKILEDRLNKLHVNSEDQRHNGLVTSDVNGISSSYR